MKFKLLFSYRFLLFILSVIGVYLQLTKHGGFGMMLYYTILSNMLVMFFMGDMVWRMLRGRSTQTQGYLRLKGGVTMSIMITCVIYHFMLAPIATPEKFYRLDAARATNRGGAGLGLAIAKEIVNAHGGAIECISTPEHTVFTITLPE